MSSGSDKLKNADSIAAFLFIQRLTHDIKEKDIKSPLDKLVFDIRKLLGSRVNIIANKFLSIKNLNKDNIKQYVNSFNPKGYSGFKRVEDKLNEGNMDILDKIKLVIETEVKHANTNISTYENKSGDRVRVHHTTGVHRVEVKKKGGSSFSKHPEHNDHVGTSHRDVHNHLVKNGHKHIGDHKEHHHSSEY